MTPAGGEITAPLQGPTLDTQAPTAPPAWWAVELGTIAALVGRDLRRFFRQRSRILGSLAQPLILWGALGAGFGKSFQPPGLSVDYLTYFYPGVIVLTLLFSAIFATMSLIEDRHHGFLQAVLAAPSSRAALAVGKIAGGALVALFQVAVLLALAPLAGFSFSTLGPGSWALVAGVLVLAAFAFTALGFVVAWWIDSTQGYHAIMSVVLIPLWMLSGAMYPPGGGSALMQSLMRFDPVTYVVAGLRRGLSGAALPEALVPAAATTVTSLAVTAGLALVTGLAAVFVCRRGRG